MKYVGAIAPLIALTPALSVPNEARAQDLPNIVVVMIDDLGYGEFPSYGNTFNETPHIDRLAGEGILFTNAYAPAPVCSPARASYYTGQYTPRHGILDFIPRNSPLYLNPDDHVTMNEALKDAGYYTGVIGKWHLDTDFANPLGGPEAHGFDWVFGTETDYIAGGDYFFPYSKISTITTGEENEFLPDRLFAEARQFMEDRAGGPFFLSLQLFSVHMTLEAPHELVSKYKAKYEAKYGPGSSAHFDNSSPRHAGAPDNPYMAGMLERIDAGVGSIMQKLEELGLAENTILVVTSDNGGDEYVANNGGLRAAKTWLYEGGIRVPLIIRYPAMGLSGAVDHSPVNFIDFYPTFLELAGGSTTQLLDGVSIAPLLQGGSIDRDEMYWYYPAGINTWNARKACVIRKGDHKLIYRFGLAPDFYELYNLAEDSGEQVNLYNTHPGKSAELKARLDEWMDEMGLLKWAEGEDKVFDFETDFPAAYGTNGNIIGPGNPANDQEDVHNEYFVRVANPFPGGLNSSDTVGRFTRLKTGYWWGYAWFNFGPVYVSATEATPKYVHVMVNKPLTSRVCIQMVGPNNFSTPEVVRVNSRENEWEDLVFEVTNPGWYNQIQIKPDFENSANPPYPGRLSEDIHIYIDEILINDDPTPRGGSLEEFGEKLILDFEEGFYGRYGTNGNGSGYGENHPAFQVVDNPGPSGLNPSPKVGRFQRKQQGNWWAYAWFEFEPLEITQVPVYVHVLVNKPLLSPVTIQIKDRHAQPASNSGEIINHNQAYINEWQDMVFKINNPGTYSYFEFKPDFLNQNPASRLTGDIMIYFDGIIVSDDPSPRTVTTRTGPGPEAEGLRVYPTLTRDRVFLSRHEEAPVKVRIFDIKGTLMTEQLLEGQSGTFDFSAYSPGMYILQYRGHQSTRSTKIIKH